MTFTSDGPGASISVSGVPDDLLSAFDEWCDEEGHSRSAAIRTLMADAVEHDTHGPDAIRPDSDVLAAIYDALRHASSDRFVFREGSGLSTVAVTTGISAEEIQAQLTRLERAGFVAPKGTPNVRARGADEQEWHIKPPHATVDAWRHNPERRAERAERRRQARLQRMTSSDGVSDEQAARKRDQLRSDLAEEAEA